MKKFIALIFAVIAGICTVMAQNRTFTVGFDAGFPPYGYTENGEYKGFDLDLAREVARRRGWTVKLKPINWDAKDSELNSGMIDCIWNGFTINGRENSYTWSDPYVINEQVVMVKSASPVKSLADLKGKKVAVQTDTPVQKALSPNGECYELGKTFSGLVVVPDYNNAVMQLESGSVDAVALDVGVARTKLKTGNFRLLDEIVIVIVLVAGLRSVCLLHACYFVFCIVGIGGRSAGYIGGLGMVAPAIIRIIVAKPLLEQLNAVKVHIVSTVIMRQVNRNVGICSLCRHRGTQVLPVVYIRVKADADGFRGCAVCVIEFYLEAKFPVDSRCIHTVFIHGKRNGITLGPAGNYEAVSSIATDHYSLISTVIAGICAG